MIKNTTLTDILIETGARDNYIVREIGSISSDRIWYYEGNDSLMSFIELNEFFFKIKKWAYKKGFYIWSGPVINGWESTIYFKEEKMLMEDNFKADSEVKSVMKALEFIEKTLEDQRNSLF